MQFYLQVGTPTILSPLTTTEESLFKRTLAHEYVERGLMAAGLPYRSLAEETWTSDEEGDVLSEPTSDHYGAHDLAPHQEPEISPFHLIVELSESALEKWVNVVFSRHKSRR